MLIHLVLSTILHLSDQQVLTFVVSRSRPLNITTGDGGVICNNDLIICAQKAKWFGVDRDSREGRDVWRGYA